MAIVRAKHKDIEGGLPRRVSCAPGASCPIYHDHVSDRCPVMVDWR